MCLTGVDYFSTLGYQPGIAALAAGAVAPIATVVLVALTLFGALPVYRRVARESPHGEGSIAMLERVLPWWSGKLFVLVLLGFAATDFTITMTLSAADASAHLLENPYTSSWLGGHAIGVTLVLLGALGAIFLKGFREAITLAVVLVALYLALNVVVVAVGLAQVASHPAVFSAWTRLLTTEHPNWLAVVGVALLVFPKLALGLSGFETGVAVMPQISGDPTDTEKKPLGRIRGAHHLLATAALIMSVALILSTLVTTLLIPPAAFQPGGPANGRALAYLAHQYLGQRLRHALRPEHHRHLVVRRRLGDGRPAQPGAPLPAPLRHGAPLGPRGAPTGVRLHRDHLRRHLVVPGQRRRAGRRLRHRRPGAHHLGLGRRHPLRSPASPPAGDSALRHRVRDLRLHHVANIIERPDGLRIGILFILAIIVVSFLSRAQRAFELRGVGHQLRPRGRAVPQRDDAVRTLRLIAHDPNLRDADEYRDKVRKVRGDNDIPKWAPVVFIEVTVVDAVRLRDGAVRARRGTLWAPHPHRAQLRHRQHHRRGPARDPKPDRPRPPRVLHLDGRKPPAQPAEVPLHRRRRNRTRDP